MNNSHFACPLTSVMRKMFLTSRAHIFFFFLTDSMSKSLLHSVFRFAWPDAANPPLHLVMKSTRPDQTKRDVKLHLHRSTFTCAGTSTLTVLKGWKGRGWGVAASSHGGAV